jgi:hypothetical protein
MSYDDLNGNPAAVSANLENAARGEGHQAIKKIPPKEAMRLFLKEMATNSSVPQHLRHEAMLLNGSRPGPGQDVMKQRFFDRVSKDDALMKIVDSTNVFKANLGPERLPKDLRERAYAGTLSLEHAQLLHAANQVHHEPNPSHSVTGLKHQGEKPQYAGLPNAPRMMGA